jgi:hypothetical protein
VPTDDFAQLQLQVVDQIQWRYEVIRPMVLFADRTARQRAHETHTHPATVRRLARGFRQRGMLGLLPADVEVVIWGRAKRISGAVRQEIERLKALYDGFHYRFPVVADVIELQIDRVVTGTPRKPRQIFRDIYGLLSRP